jgi:tripartite-type tricarboxylate transporter receptor subunit TctC
MTRIFSIIVAVVLVISFSANAHAGQSAAYDEKTVANFYRGKTVTILVGHSAGGGFDTYARVISRHLGKYIPGNPNVVVNNIPGAGTIISANYTFNPRPRTVR